MATMSRREMLKTSALAVAGIATKTSKASSFEMKDKTEKRVPLIHTTDLYHPPQDPDDQIDLATVMALEEFDVRGIILDTTQRFLDGAPNGFDIKRDPGFIPVNQLNYLTGRATPVATGPSQPLTHSGDTAIDRPKHEQAGINLLLEILQQSAVPVVISVVGSTRVVTAAYNRNPELMREKTQAILLNAGSTGGPKTEWNVGLDLAAYIGLWQSGLPIHWYPCATERSAFVRKHERGTYWKTSHAKLFKGLPEKLIAWFAYGFSGSARGDFIGALEDLGRGAVWEHVLAGERNIWATVSLVMAAGRVLAQTPEGWRFVPQVTAKNFPVWSWRLDPISATVSSKGIIEWQLTQNTTSNYLFGRRPDVEFGDAMTEALNALLRTLLA